MTLVHPELTWNGLAFPYKERARTKCAGLTALLNLLLCFRVSFWHIFRFGFYCFKFALQQIFLGQLMFGGLDHLCIGATFNILVV